MPSANWLVADDVGHSPSGYNEIKALEQALSEEEFQKEFSKLKALMYAWIGSDRDQEPTEAVLSSYRALLQTWGPLDLWRINI